MVYNGKSRILNKVQLTPHFALPNMYTHMRAIQHGTNMGGINIGEMFLNFTMHKSLRNAFGVDATHILS